MLDDVIGYVFNDKVVIMSIIVLNLIEVSVLLCIINKCDIKDVCVIDFDLVLVLESGYKIIISCGVVVVVNLL